MFIKLNDSGKIRSFRISVPCDDTGYDLFHPSVEECVDGVYQPFEIKAVTFAGERLSEEDVMLDILFRLTANQKDFEMSYEEDETKLKFEIDSYLLCVRELCSDELKFSEFGRVVPSSLLYNDDVFDLMYATDKYCYYAFDDMFIMLDTESGELISDNYFAEVGLDDSLSAVESGEEKQLYRSDEFITE